MHTRTRTHNQRQTNQFPFRLSTAKIKTFLSTKKKSNEADKTKAILQPNRLTVPVDHEKKKKLEPYLSLQRVEGSLYPSRDGAVQLLVCSRTRRPLALRSFEIIVFVNFQPGTIHVCVCHKRRRTHRTSQMIDSHRARRTSGQQKRHEEGGGSEE